MIVGTGLAEGECKIQPQPSAGAVNQHGLPRNAAAQQSSLLHGVIQPLPSSLSCMAAHAYPGNLLRWLRTQLLAALLQHCSHRT